MDMSRNRTLDVMKGMGIILVVLGHAIQKNVPDYQSHLLFNIIYSFHMPLFFVVAGYLMYLTIKADRLLWIRNKAAYLLVPHVIFNVIFYFVSSTGWPNFENLPKQFSFVQWMTESLFLNRGEWFLWTLFAIFSLMLLIDLIERQTKTPVFWVFVCTFVVGIVSIPVPGRDYLRVLEIQWYLPFALVGYLIAKYGKHAKKLTNIVSVVGLAAFPVVMWITEWNGGWARTPLYGFAYYWNAGDPFVYLTRFLQAIMGISVVFLIARWAGKATVLSGPLSWLGGVSLGIFLFHQIFSGLGFGSGPTVVFSAFILSLLLGIVLTVVCQWTKPLGILLGDLTYLKKVPATSGQGS